LGSKRLRPPRKIQRKCPITVNVLPQKKKSPALSESEVHWYLMFLGEREDERERKRERVRPDQYEKIRVLTADMIVNIYSYVLMNLPSD
jgi:hypothetical protein